MEHNDEIIRKEFAKAFNWYEYSGGFGYTSRKHTPLTPSWEEIFVELGKVLERGRIEISGVEMPLNITQ